MQSKGRRTYFEKAQLQYVVLHPSRAEICGLLAGSQKPCPLSWSLFYVWGSIPAYCLRANSPSDLVFAFFTQYFWPFMVLVIQQLFMNFAMLIGVLLRICNLLQGNDNVAGVSC